jgi:hypothetical protein
MFSLREQSNIIYLAWRVLPRSSITVMCGPRSVSWARTCRTNVVNTYPTLPGQPGSLETGNTSLLTSKLRGGEEEEDKGVAG